MRMMRKAGLVKSIVLPSLYEFWSDATVVTYLGASSSTAQEYSGLSVGNTSTPLWTISSKGDAWEIDKLKDNEIARWGFKREPDSSPLWAYIDATSTISTTKMNVSDQGQPLYGYVLAGLRFPSFSETVVDWMLFNKIRVEFLENAYNYGSDASVVYIADADLSSDPNDVYLQFACSSSAGYISATRGGTPGTAIMSSGSRAFWRHYNSRYYLSSSGTTNMSTRAGGLYRITL